MKMIYIYIVLILSFGCKAYNENLIKAKYLKLRSNHGLSLPVDNQLSVFKYEKSKEKIKDNEKLLEVQYLILKEHMINFGIKNIDSLFNDYKKHCKNNVYINKLSKIYNHHIDLKEGHLIKPYKDLNNNTLDAHIFYPKDTSANKKYPVIVLFHGGGWSSGKVETQFAGCEYFSKKGIIAVAPEYRLIYRHGSYVNDCIEDAKSLIRWLRENGDDLKIDTSKIAAAGFSAGGHLVACTEILNGFESNNENLSISSKPNAMILYNAGLIPSYRNYFGNRFLPDNFDKDLISPFLHIRSKLVPSIILHGTNDKICKFKTAVDFENKMNEYGNNCKLYEFKSHGHYLTSTKEGAKKLHKITDNFLETLKFY